MFWLLVRTKLIGAKNVALDTWRNRPAVAAALCLAGICLFGGMFLGFLVLLKMAAQYGVLEETIYQAFYYFFLLLFAGAVPFVASTLLQSSDYSLLFAAPIPPRTVVAAKLLDATLTNSAQFTVLGIPAIVACAFALRLPPVAWLLVVLLIALFVLLPALLTALALLLALAALGITRLRSAITLINVLMGVGVCITFVLEARNLPFKYGVTGSFQPALHSVSPTAHMLPSAWFAGVFVGLAEGHASATISAVALSVRIGLLCVALFAACMALGGRLLSLSSVGEDHGGHGKIRPTGAASLALMNVGRRLLGGQTSALMVKDLRYLVRDNMMLSQLSVPMILFLVPYLIGLQNGAMDARTELFPFSAVIITFILFIQTSILSLSLLGMEAEGFWMALLAPAARHRILWAKWLFSTLASGGTAVLLCLIAAITFHAEPLWILVESLVLMLWAAGLCGLGVGISALFPRFVHENPAIRVSPIALIVSFFATMAYMVASLCLIVFLWLVYGGLHATTLLTPLLTTALGGLLLLTLIAVSISMWLGIKRIERFEWQH